MNVDQTVRTFLDFYQERGHLLISEHSLVPPPGDPVLFTTSGMHPLTPYLSGRPHPQGPRLVNRQRCLRTTDLYDTSPSLGIGIMSTCSPLSRTARFTS